MSNPPFGQEMHEFKLVLVGAGGVGKTTFVKAHMGGEYETKYVATMGVEIHPVIFHTKRGPIKFNVWDTAGQEDPGESFQKYYIGAKCAIIMFDVTRRTTFLNAKNWERDLGEAMRPIPFIWVGNKADNWKYDHKVKPKDMVFKCPELNASDHFVSAKTKFNFEMPFLWLTRKLLRDDSLEFIPDPAEHPPKMVIDDETKADVSEQAAGARPDEDEVGGDVDVEDLGAYGE